ncbi:MAG: phosphomethylpyrimidine synthase ThiC [Desulfurococcaceae archaeon]
MPNIDQVKEGLIASRIAVHADDLVKLSAKASVKDIEVSMARAILNWEK